MCSGILNRQYFCQKYHVGKISLVSGFLVAQEVLGGRKYPQFFLFSLDRMDVITCLVFTLQDMNEPSNFVVGSTEGCTTNKYDNPPFTPSIVGGSLSQKTLCPSARHGSDLHYNLHSLYGHSELMATQMCVFVYLCVVVYFCVFLFTSVDCKY